MKDKVLIRKQAGSGGIMYTREVGGRGQGGGFMQDLAALRGGARGLNAQGQQSFIPGAQLGDAKPTGMQRLAAGANIAGRGLAAALTGLQTAYGLQGGNVSALGSVGDTYAQNVQGLTANRPTEAQQAQDMATEAFNQQQQTMAQQAMQQATPPAGLPAQTPDVTTDASRTARLSGPPGSAQRAWRDRGGFGFAPPGWTPPAAPAAPAPPTPPAAPAPAVDQVTPIAQALNALPDIRMRPTGPAQPQQTFPPIPQTVQTQLPEGQPPQPEQVVPQGQPYAGTPTSMIDPATGRPYNQREYFKFLQRQQNKSFATYVLDEFGDMLHKADPHVAGLLAFKVYMDKVMR